MKPRSWRTLVCAAVLLTLAACGRGPTGTPAGATGAGLELGSTDDLRDKRVGVVVGSAQDVYAAETYPQATILQYQSGTDLLLAVMTGKVDAGLGDEEPIRELMRRNSDLTILGEPLFASPVAAGFRKRDPELTRQFNGFLAEIRQNGIHDDMVARWLRRRDTRMPKIRSEQPDGQLVVGTTVGTLPFGAMQDGELVGFDIELARRFAAHVGKQARFSQMEFGGLIAALASGKIDMIVASMFITEERLQSIDFSEPYFMTNARAYVLESNLAGAEAQEVRRRDSFASRVADSFYSNIIREKRYLLIWDGLKTTVFISIFATLLGTLLGALVCFMRMSRSTALSVSARAYINLLRGTPVLVLLMVIFYVVFASVNINPVLVAIIAFGMNFAAYAAEIFRSGIESVDRGQTEAGIAMGFTPARAFLYIVLPQTVRRILPVYKGEIISLVKMTSIVGYIAVQDLTKASDIIRSRTFDAFFPLLLAALLYFVIAWSLLLGLGYLERVTDPKIRRRRAAAR